MQPKAKTLQERMGFRDDELSTPKHDEIMLWLDENVRSLFPDKSGDPWEPELMDEIREIIQKEADKKYIEENSKSGDVGDLPARIWARVNQSTLMRECEAQKTPRVVV